MHSVHAYEYKEAALIILLNIHNKTNEVSCYLRRIRIMNHHLLDIITTPPRIFFQFPKQPKKNMGAAASVSKNKNATKAARPRIDSIKKPQVGGSTWKVFTKPKTTIRHKNRKSTLEYA